MLLIEWAYRNWTMLKFSLDELQTQTNEPDFATEFTKDISHYQWKHHEVYIPLAMNGQQQRRQAKEKHNCKERKKKRRPVWRFRLLCSNVSQVSLERGEEHDYCIKNYGERIEG